MINERETHFLSFISIYTAHVNAAPVTAHVNAARVTAHVNAAPVTAHVNAARVTAHLNWKLNAPYLEDDEYYSLMCNVIDQCSNINIESSQTKWEICKLEIITASIKYTKSKSRQRSNRS